MAERTFWQWWNTWPALAIRVAFYAVILIVFLYWPRRSPSQPEPADEVPEAPPPVPLEPGEEIWSLQGYAPQAELLAWSRRDLPDGGQEVQVLVRFLANVRDMDWRDAKLRPPKGQGGDNLAEAEAPAGRAAGSPPDPEDRAPKPELGPAKLLFHLRPGSPPFAAGRVFCWNKDLCALPPEQRVSPEELDVRLKQEPSKTSAPEKPASPAPPPPAATEKP